MQSSIAGSPSLRRRDLDQQVRPVDLLVQRERLLERLLGLVGEPWVDLERDEAVMPVRLVPDRPQHVAGVAHVVDREREEDLDRVVGRLEQAFSCSS